MLPSAGERQAPGVALVPGGREVRMVGRIRPGGRQARGGRGERARGTVAAAPERVALNGRIAEFYDESSGLWEDVWGEHMHHGIYREASPPKSHTAAQVEMIDEVLKWADVKNVNRMVDVGCGIGGSSRHIIRKYGCTSTGITLSAVQAARANEITAAAGLGDRGKFIVADALDQPFEDNSFDLVWSMESGEHMPDKRKFVSELLRVCAPGGKIIIVTWCHRVLATEEKELTPPEKLLLGAVSSVYALPDWVSAEEYKKEFAALGIQDVRVEDWTADVAPFWTAVLQSALTVKGLRALMSVGPTTWMGALAIPIMRLGYQTGLIKFNLITVQK
ncbi:unnamed protein product [Ostreobium quekettii]|uniref:Methyltransferase type 11 domain-containing protein n=1 Tax=Ostreobium quekettii TaxID=121088 RepID=A0A8S1J5H0_9CHLO|nr:unnamed protein product [Ostreobium quekettii]|eukprot:evm.model.scf_1728.2 EVM.evm.TU.scf_1728.2   scf_1728:7304-12410(+)